MIAQDLRRRPRGMANPHRCTVKLKFNVEFAAKLDCVIGCVL